MTNLIWLIDVGYVTKASKGTKIDYIKTKKFLEAKFNKTCIPILFNGIDKHNIDIGLTQFYYTVEKAGFTIKLYEMEGGAQKQVDVAIGAHLVYHALKGDDIVLSSGDVDFVPAVQMAKKDKNVNKVFLFTFKLGVHEELIRVTDSVGQNPTIQRDIPWN